MDLKEFIKKEKEIKEELEKEITIKKENKNVNSFLIIKILRKHIQALDSITPNEISNFILEINEEYKRKYNKGGIIKIWALFLELLNNVDCVSYPSFLKWLSTHQNKGYTYKMIINSIQIIKSRTEGFFKLLKKR
jgi:hypothetical protein